MTMAMLPYEEKQHHEILAWKDEKPGVISRTWGYLLAPIAWLVNQVVPAKSTQAALESANAAGKWLADKEDLLRDAGVQSIDELRQKDLELSDRLADSCHNWAIGIASAEGAVTGVGGILTAPVDIPAIITIATRTIHKIGLCYGFECQSPEDKQFVLGVLAAAGSNTMREKLSALASLRLLQQILAKQTWKKMAEKSVEQQVSREGALVALRSLAKQLGINLTKRRALAAIPVVGAAVGGSVNGWYIKEVGWAARRVFQERWLVANDKLGMSRE